MPAGFEIKLGFQKDPTVFSRVWPAPTPTTITQLINALSETVDIELDQQTLVTRDSRMSPQFVQLLRSLVGGGFVVNMDYEGLEFIFLAAMGLQARRIGTTLQPEDVDSALAYQHIFEMDNQIDSQTWKAGDGFLAGDGIIAGQQKVRRGTYVIDKQTSVWEATSCMVSSLVLQFQSAGPIVEVELVGHDITYNSTTNANIGLLNCAPNRVLFQDVSVFIKDLGGAGFTDSDKVQTTGVSLNIENNLDVITTRDTGKKIEEPKRGGGYAITGSVGISRYLDNNLTEKNRLNEFFSMKIECIGATIPGTTTPFELSIWLPLCQFTGQDIDTSGAGQITQNFGFTCSPGFVTGQPDTATTGPMIVQLVNENSTHTLL